MPGLTNHSPYANIKIQMVVRVEIPSLADKLVIHGGRPLRGKVRISGAKNSVLKLMAACLLTKEPVTLSNVPNISDVDVVRAYWHDHRLQLLTCR